MQIKPAAIMLAAAIAALCLPVFSSAAGTRAFQFLQVGVGARPAAMGNAFAAMSGDLNAAYWNPAGLAGLERATVSMSHAVWLQDITYSNVVYGRQVAGGVVALGFNILNTGDIQEVGVNGTPLPSSYSMSDKMGLISYARRFGGLSLGAGLKYISSSLEVESSRALAADFGAQYGGLRLWGRDFTLGASIQNIGGRTKYVSESSSLPVLARAGVALSPAKGITLASDLLGAEENIYFHGGAEYTRNAGSVVLAARAGFANDTIKELGGLSGLTAGLGLAWKDMQFDYAWNSFTDLGGVQRFSLAFKFN